MHQNDSVSSTVAAVLYGVQMKLALQQLPRAIRNSVDNRR